MVPLSSSTAAEALLIRGYLPVRVRFPSAAHNNNDDDDEAQPPPSSTFFYVKPHTHPSKQQQPQQQQHQQAGTTLFVANAPSFPASSLGPQVLLQSLLGRYGRITRVTVVPRPKSSHSNHRQDVDHEDSPAASTTTTHEAYFSESSTTTDRFAHVVFASPKDLNRCYQALVRVMRSSSTDSVPPALVVDALERQTLLDQMEQRRQLAQEEDEEEDNDVQQSQADVLEPETRGIAKVFNSYRRHCQKRAQRQALLEDCDAVMEDYEAAEQLKRQAAASEPDADGFVTVTHDSQAAAASLEQQSHGRTARPSKGRTRKRKKGAGSSERTDFYRFQTKAARRDAVHTLRQRFQEDLERIQKIKSETGGFKPFG
jgi:ribosomal RNA-processing protein 7